MAADIRERIEQQVRNTPVVLYMKGTRRAPQCGFSATVVGILDQLIDDYETVDVLADATVRQGVKEYSDWPTIPQLYVKGEFVGGCDIVKELFGNGELEALLGAKVAEVPAPKITVSDEAARALSQALANGNELIRLEVDESFHHGLSIGPSNPKDVILEVNGVRIARDRTSAKRADGAVIDFVASANGEADGGAFKITNPNEPPRVKRISVEQLKAELDRGAPIELFDARTAREREIAALPASRLLDADAQKHIMTLPKDRPLVFMCHHGGRSQQAAEFFLNQGFLDVSNVDGGIDAWATRIDPGMTKY